MYTTTFKARFLLSLARSILLISAFLCFTTTLPAQEISNTKSIISQPVLQVDFPFPTSDKPQSKLWYRNKSWWALLPRSNGPSLWERTNSGWKEHLSVNKELSGLPGRADCWPEKNSITAVGVGSQSLTVFRIEFDQNSSDKTTSKQLATLSPPVTSDPIETATISKDNKNNWWVAADAGTAIYTWHSADGITWSDPIKLGDGISKDDICAIVALPKSVLVLWSDQNKDGVYCREHISGQAHDSWKTTQVIQQGGLTADDHINAAISKDGTLWLATKNSLDEIGQPQLVLRVRSKKGKWSNYPYSPRETTQEPSRPVVIATPDGRILSGNTVYYKKSRFDDHIEFGVIDVKSNEILTQKTKVIAPDPALQTKMNDITKSRNLLPADAEWIVLSSDSKGRVFETNLRDYFEK